MLLALGGTYTRFIDIFREMDVNNDGQISRREFRHAMAKLGLSMSPAEFEDVFNHFDPDESGTIDFAELSRELRCRRDSRALVARNRARNSASS